LLKYNYIIVPPPNEFCECIFSCGRVCKNGLTNTIKDVLLDGSSRINIIIEQLMLKLGLPKPKLASSLEE
jgi:hypothetical protein